MNNFIKGAPKGGEKTTVILYANNYSKPSQESKSMPKKDINSQLGFLRKNVIIGNQQMESNLDQLYANNF